MAAYDDGYDQGEDMEIAILDGSIEMDIDLSEEELLIGELHSYRSTNVLSPKQHEKNFYGIPVETQQVDYSVAINNQYYNY
uniref:Uncharacterized protein n=1 Tax=Amphimedon queenslandica TaxID=400682 RepID=A0A1X7UH66_AMPQE